jgi:hypothetical protein
VIDKGDPATNASFYDVACQEVGLPFRVMQKDTKTLQDNPFSISWGWDYTDDFTVMTVVNETSQMEAFFGYNDPNAVLPVSNYTDVGPNPTQHT